MTERLSKLRAVLLGKAQDWAGFLPFDMFMKVALYTPQLGYYTATYPVGSAASGADFTTAPEISPLFGHTLARAIAPCFDTTLPKVVLECGAGTGKLAKDVLDGLAGQGIALERYCILELSDSLRAQQQALLAAYPCVQWLSTLPNSFEGVVLANELLDAMPVRSFAIEYGRVYERGVTWSDTAQAWQWMQRSATATDSAAVLSSVSDEVKTLPRYELERCEQAYAWVTSTASHIQRGTMLLIDYGFARGELYHPQRAGGTLMAHRLHLAMPDVLAHVGDADITAHIDFTAVAHAAQQQGMDCVGYVNQARFLINAGIADAYSVLTQDAVNVPQSGTQPGTHSTAHSVVQAQLSRGLQLLMSEAEMGELFKVIAFTKNGEAPAGFERGDRSHRLQEDTYA
jgi:SAM-dependent MidA family methyltransferase